MSEVFEQVNNMLRALIVEWIISVQKSLSTTLSRIELVLAILMLWISFVGCLF